MGVTMGDYHGGLCVVVFCSLLETKMASGNVWQQIFDQ